MAVIHGNVLKYGDNINTDIISPPRYMELSYEEIAQHAMEGVDDKFSERLKPGDIVVAGANFGSGSSRETAPIALKYAHTGAIIAKFYARIFFRNAINIGLPVIQCKDVDSIDEGDELDIDLTTGKIVNLTKHEEYQGSTLPPHIMELVDVGGLIPYLKQKLKK